ncbi:hypothetical protein SO802_016216 [Lithocarpus litseifolius]|uniref:Uncharacterized protein n=1 Tax=Lithocarpus litseifolius TaxID=425828 RepID=A0AAW2CZ92_9ROSI
MAVSKYGKLDIMFNNVGISGKAESRILESENDNFKRVLHVNIFGAFLGTKHAARVMIPAKKGSILFTSSLASILADDISHSYVASKHAVVGMAKNLSVELGQYGIRVNFVAPFATATPLLTNALGKMEKKKVEDVVSSAANLKGVVLEPKDIAEAALFLGSDESKYVSGLNLVVVGPLASYNFSSLYNRTKDILSVVMALLFALAAEPSPPPPIKIPVATDSLHAPAPAK